MTRPMFHIETVGHYSDGSPVLMSRVTIAALDVQSRKVGRHPVVIQGEKHPGVDPSAGTHDELRFIDVDAVDGNRNEQKGREVGFAAFHRTAAQGFTEHTHEGLLIKGVGDDVHTAPLAGSQLAGYRLTPPWNGLGAFDSEKDTHHVPTPRVEFDWDAYTEGRYDEHGNVITRARARRLAAIRHNRDITRTVRRLRAVRRKAQNPKVRNRISQFVRELLGLKIKPKADIDLQHHH